MAAVCPLAAAPDLFGVCNKGPWVERQTELRFLVAGVAVYTVNFPAMILQSPFTHVMDGDSALPPPPVEFPRGIEVARIFACPMREKAGEKAPPILLLPGTIRYVSGQSRHFYIELSGSFADYLAGFSSKSRNTLRRKVRKFCQAAGTTAPLRVFTRP